MNIGNTRHGKRRQEGYMITRYKPAKMDNIILVQSPMTVTRGKCFPTHLTCPNETCSALSPAPSPHTGDDN